MAQLIDGKSISQKVLRDASEELKKIQVDYPGFKPKLAIVQVGDRGDSNVYIRNKIQRASEVGFDAELIKLGVETTQRQLEARIDALNADKTVDGIIVQLPLDTVNEIDADDVVDRIAQSKDVDGLTRENAGRLARGELADTIFPCTPYGCLHLVHEATGDPNYVKGKKVVVVGRSKIVGSPAAALFMWHHGTATICHSRTADLREQCQQADILIVAIGQRELIHGDWIKPGALVIDCGINVEELDSGKRRLRGDVHFDSAREKAGYITPVPGGVGPMTVAMLIKNTLKQAIATKLKHISATKWNFKPLELNVESNISSDIAISRAQHPKNITQLAHEIGIHDDELEQYGTTKAKVSLKVLGRLANRPNGKYVVIAGITPTPLGEGKSTTVMGLAQALGAHLELNAFACVRQPSQGPTFGIKGGAAGGGYAQVIPMEEFNLHLTGDIHAIEAAHNLLAAAIDARYFHESTQTDEALFNRLVHKNKDGQQVFSAAQKRRLERLGIDPAKQLDAAQRRRFARLDIDPAAILWHRVVDVNDRFLRQIEVGRGAAEKGHVLQSKFAITVSSELMAILALADSLANLRERISRCVVALDRDGRPITADDIGITGALTVIMKDTVKPNLMQTLEGTPVFVHAGPFANIAHGNSSILADQLALKLVGPDGYVITEAGFGADIGLEKFVDIKCRASGLRPDVAVIVATVRALKLHGGAPLVDAGGPLPSEYTTSNVELVKKGCETNLKKQIEIVRTFGIPVVVCINKFDGDSDEELNVIIEAATGHGAADAVVGTHWADGGRGALALARAVIDVCDATSAADNKFKLLYEDSDSIESKIERVASAIYGAAGVDFSPMAKKQIERFTSQEFGRLPICMAKTQYSLTADPSVKGAPRDFRLPIDEIQLSAGAGFLTPLCGAIMTMPGLPTRPCFFDIDIDPETELIEGLF